MASVPVPRVRFVNAGRAPQLRGRRGREHSVPCGDIHADDSSGPSRLEAWPHRRWWASGPCVVRSILILAASTTAACMIDGLPGPARTARSSTSGLIPSRAKMARTPKSGVVTTMPQTLVKGPGMPTEMADMLPKRPATVNDPSAGLRRIESALLPASSAFSWLQTSGIKIPR